MWIDRMLRDHFFFTALGLLTAGTLFAYSPYPILNPIFVGLILPLIIIREYRYRKWKKRIHDNFYKKGFKDGYEEGQKIEEYFRRKWDEQTR